MFSQNLLLVVIIFSFLMAAILASVLVLDHLSKKKTQGIQKQEKLGEEKLVGQLWEEVEKNDQS